MNSDVVGKFVTLCPGCALGLRVSGWTLAQQLFNTSSPCVECESQGPWQGRCVYRVDRAPVALPRYDLAQTGRTSSSAPNISNMMATGAAPAAEPCENCNDTGVVSHLEPDDDEECDCSEAVDGDPPCPAHPRSSEAQSDLGGPTDLGLPGRGDSPEQLPAWVVVAYVWDRREQYKSSSGTYEGLSQIIAGLGRGAHVDAWKHGELDDLKKDAERVMRNR